MSILEIILLIIVFIWLIDISYSRLKILKFIEVSARALEEAGSRINSLENRINQLEGKWEEKFSDSDSE